MQAASDKQEVIVTGAGGQGVLTMGKLLAQAAMHVYKHVSFRPSYGVEARGGTSECAVILSENEILMPALVQAQTVIVMDPAQVKACADKVKPGGTLIVEKERLAERVEREDIKILMIPANKLAREIGSTLSANLLFLGAYIEETRALSLNIVEGELEAAGDSEAVLRGKKEALRTGAKLVANHSSTT
ncbi:2-oxoacid:acceptor oxidoreductase family protein [Chloroflexota bacterium]